LFRDVAIVGSFIGSSIITKICRVNTLKIVHN
jgi:hypothetical protein